MKIVVPVLETEVKGKKLVNAHFGKSKHFAVVDTETGNVEVIENPGIHLPRRRGIYIAEMFKEKGVQAVLVKEMGAGAFDKIRNVMGIKVYLIPPEIKFLDEAVEAFKEMKLKELPAPNEEPHEH